MSLSEPERAAPRDAVGGSQEIAKLGGSWCPNTANPEPEQAYLHRSSAEGRVSSGLRHLALGLRLVFGLFREVLGGTDPAILAVICASTANLLSVRP